MANMKSMSVYKKFWTFAIGILLIALGLSSGLIVLEVIVSLIGLYFVIASIMGSFKFLNVLFSKKGEVAVKSENLESGVKKISESAKSSKSKKTVSKKPETKAKTSATKTKSVRFLRKYN